MKQRGFEVAKDFLDMEISMPERSTKNSAGYDFFAIEDTVVPSYYGLLLERVVSGDAIKPTMVKTGIKAYMEEVEVLSIYNRSSNPGKKGLILANSVGIIDSDYYFSENEGHIFVCLKNEGVKEVNINKGDRFVQGIFTPYLLTDDDSATGNREGGIGSTNKGDENNG